ncbi:helix-turn-helix domain-containing protein [bacterium]|nr:helix-turn-helix domain-containing protein [bacterium]
MNDYIPHIGQRLKAARKQCFPLDDLRAFSIRIGVSRATYQKMEKGALSVSLNSYYQAATVLGLTHTFDTMFRIEASLFDD